MNKVAKVDMAKINWPDLVLSPSISKECRERISKSRPKTFGQLKKVEGIRPATISFVALGL